MKKLITIRDESNVLRIAKKYALPLIEKGCVYTTKSVYKRAKKKKNVLPA